MQEPQEHRDTHIKSKRSFGEKLNSRKLALTVGSILTAAALLVGGYIDGAQWVNITTVLGGAYMASQVYVDVRGNKNP